MFTDMLKDFLKTYGATGREDKIADTIKNYVEAKADEVYTDVMGNLIAVRRGISGKKIMLSAHMDQIGLIVIDIDDRGFLRVSNVGGVNPVVTVAREVVFENGVRGVTYGRRRSYDCKALCRYRRHDIRRSCCQGRHRRYLCIRYKLC